MIVYRTKNRGIFMNDFNGEKFDVHIDGDKAIVNGREYQIGTATSSVEKQPMSVATDKGGMITAPVPGTVTQILVTEGQSVKAEDTVAIVEVMKMETAVKASSDGVVKHIFVKKGDAVKTGDKLLEV